MHLIIYTDGACWGNPGPAAIGAVIKDQYNNSLAEISSYIGKGTNNQAEYKALIAALKTAAELKANQLTIFLDSELLLFQLEGKYKVRNTFLKPLYNEANSLLKLFKSYSIKYVDHHGNEAHHLAQAALKKVK